MISYIIVSNIKCLQECFFFPFFITSVDRDLEGNPHPYAANLGIFGNGFPASFENIDDQ